MKNSNVAYKCLKDKKIVVTGAASGIGAEIAEYFYYQGSKVIIIDIDEKNAINLISNLPKRTGLHTPSFFYCDLIDIEAIKNIFSEIYEKFGFLNVLCNNAGDDNRHNWEEVTSEEWDFYQGRNLKHQFFCTREFSKYVDINEGASIICMGSISYLNGSTGMPSYTTAKSALIGLVNTMAILLAPKNIRINIIQPGWVFTEKQISKWIDDDALIEIDSKQILKGKIMPEEPAKLALFLASSQSIFITKQVINVDAGWV